MGKGYRVWVIEVWGWWIKVWRWLVNDLVINDIEYFFINGGGGIFGEVLRNVVLIRR